MSYNGAPAGLAAIFNDSYLPGCNTSNASYAQADLKYCCSSLKGNYIEQPAFCQLPETNFTSYYDCMQKRNASSEESSICAPVQKNSGRGDVALGWLGYAVVGLVCLSASLATVGA